MKQLFKLTIKKTVAEYSEIYVTSDNEDEAWDIANIYLDKINYSNFLVKTVTENEEIDKVEQIKK